MAEVNTLVRTRLAGIDTGSNGIRLIVGEVEGDGEVKVLQTLRESVRLGADVFADGVLKSKTIDEAVASFRRFKKVIGEYEAGHVTAVATSALREAKNSRELVEAVQRETGIEIRVIDAIEEAQLMLVSTAASMDLTNKTALLIDMGGGSVEVTVANNALALGCESLKLGPVRLLEKLAARGLGEQSAEFLVGRYRGMISELIRVELEDEPLELCIGAGGNLERMAKLRVELLGKTKAAKVNASDLDEMIEQLLAMKVAERVKKLGMRPDRADVIVIACIVCRMLLHDACVPRMLVPGVGLRDGLLRRMAQQVRGEG